MATEYTVKINDLLKDALPELPGVVRTVALREMRLTLREFFEKSFTWLYEITDVSIPTGETGIQLIPQFEFEDDPNVQVIGILNIAIGNPTDGFVDLTALPERPIGEDTISTNPQYWYVNSNPDELTLYPYLDTATSDTLTAKVALMPAFDIDPSANTLPRQVTLKYYDAIMTGFYARMYAHPNKPYSAPVSAEKLRDKYLRMIGTYAAQRKQGYNGAPNWTFPRGWK